MTRVSHVARRCCFPCVALCLPALLCAQEHRGTPIAAKYRIEYATFLGGDQWDQAREVIPYADGTVLVGGMTASANLPTTPGVVQPLYAGDDPRTGHGGVVGGDAFLVRLSADGAKILAATYFGGSKQERGVYGMLLDSEGNIVIGSATRSSDMPTTAGAYQRRYGGGEADMYAAKLSPDLKKLLWCTYVGSSDTDWPRGGIALDGRDDVYLVGGSTSRGFPTTEGAYQEKPRGDRDAVIVKLSADGSRLLFGTFLGGSGWDGIMGVRVDAAGDLFVAGHTRSSDFPVTSGAPQTTPGGKSDCFLAKLSRDGRRLIYSTYLGGAENEFAEHRPVVGTDGSFIVTGVTSSPDFPVTDAAFQRKKNGRTDGFVVKLVADGRSFAFSTLLGGSAGEFFLMPVPDRDGKLIVVGHTQSSDFPVTPGAVQAAYAGGKGPQDGDGALAVLNSSGTRLLYASYLGGSGDDLIRSVALAQDGALYLVGSTSSPDFPATPRAVQKTLAGRTDAFVVKLAPVR